jgi:multiple sugar transport system permease protein
LAEQAASVAPRSAASRPAQTSPWLTQETLAAWLFILPSLVGFITFYAVPAVRGIYISMTNWDLLTEPSYVGLQNYAQLMQDQEFWRALRVTLYYVVLNIPLQTALGLLIAVLLDRFVQGVFLRSLLVVPWLIPSVIGALLWLWILDPPLGVLNEFLQAIGLPRQQFFNSTTQAMPTIAGVNIWRHVGYTALLIFAGLQTIPKDVYEAGALDGASEQRMFWSITLPLLRPVLIFVLVTTVVGSFQIFDTIAVTTKGGPVDATRVIYWFIYERAFNRLNFGYATAASMVLFAILVIVSLIQMRLLRVNESDLA